MLLPAHLLLLAVDGQAFTLCPHYSMVQRLLQATLLQATNGTIEMVHVSDDEHV